MRLSVMVLMLGGLAAPVMAQDGSVVVVNGQRIPSTVAAGRVLVSPEDFARAVGATVVYSPSGMTITTSAQDQRTATGVIKGTLSYYFNRNYGDKPDAGSAVYLLAGDATIRSGELFTEVSDKLHVFGGGADRNYKLVKKTIADGNGNFELAALPEGEYTLIIESNHTKDGQDKRFQHKLSIQHVSLKAGDVFDASHSFGISVV